MKTCEEIRIQSAFSLEMELIELYDLTDEEIAHRLAPIGGLRLTEIESRQDVGWVAFGILCWLAVGVTDDIAVAIRLGVARKRVVEARAWLAQERAEYEEWLAENPVDHDDGTGELLLMDRQAIAWYAVDANDCADNDTRAASSTYQQLLSGEHVAMNDVTAAEKKGA